MGTTKMACQKSNFVINEHFTQVGKMIKLAKGVNREIIDLSYQGMHVILLFKTYFAVQTRKQKIVKN